MKIRTMTFAAALVAAAAGGAAIAQQFPLLDMMADRVVQKYQSSTCEQLWEARSKPKGPREQELVTKLRSDPAARTEFLNRIAGPVANKMFDCGMIP
jgi:hypothetical protein